jgi:hypothetical protein
MFFEQQDRLLFTDPAPCPQKACTKVRQRDTLKRNGASDDDIDFLVPSDDDVSRAGASS